MMIRLSLIARDPAVSAFFSRGEGDDGLGSVFSPSTGPTLGGDDQIERRFFAAKTIDRLIDWLNAVDGDADYEAEPLESNLGSGCLEDLEWDQAEDGIADQDALEEIGGMFR